MPLIGTLIKQAVTELTRDCGAQAFTWKSTASVECIPTNYNKGSALTVGGFEEVVSLSLFVLKFVFLTADSTLVTVDSELYTVDSDMPRPVAGMTLEFRGTTFRILSATEDPTQTFYVLQLGERASMSVIVEQSGFQAAMRQHLAITRRSLPEAINARMSYVLMRAYLLTPPQWPMEKRAEVRSKLKELIGERSR